MPKDKLLSALAMCRGAGKLQIGFDAAVAAVQKGASLIVMASDIAERTKRNMLLKKARARLIQLPYTKDEVEEAVGRKFAVAAVCDANFAQLIEKNL